MLAVQHEIEKLKYATLNGLDESQKALEALQEDCRKSAELLVTDLISGAPKVAVAAQLIHDFLTFEQDVIDLFDIDPSQVVAESDSLARTEEDMQTLLASFDEKMEAMDIIGISELLQKAIPAILLRFQKLMPVLRNQVYDFINQ